MIQKLLLAIVVYFIFSEYEFQSLFWYKNQMKTNSIMIFRDIVIAVKLLPNINQNKQNNPNYINKVPKD